MPAPDYEEEFIITNAQNFVHAWLRNARRRPFDRAVRIAGRRLWGTLPNSEAQREAFRKAAHAIRVGQGHAAANPQPLREIVRLVMRRAAALTPPG